MPKIRLNYEVFVRCLDCGAERAVDNADPSKEILENNTRLILVAVQNDCPQCHNLRMVAPGNT